MRSFVACLALVGLLAGPGRAGEGAAFGASVRRGGSSTSFVEQAQSSDRAAPRSQGRRPRNLASRQEQTRTFEVRARG